MIELIALRQAVAIASAYVERHPDATVLILDMEDEMPVAEFSRRTPKDLDVEKLLTTLREKNDYWDDELQEERWALKQLVPLNPE